MFALMVGALIFMAAVVVDGGNLFQNKQSLQNGADAAAIGAALYIADDTKSCAAGAADPIGACAGLYAGLNGAKNADGTVTTQLNPCPGTVTDTKPPTSPPGCYVYPYNGTANIEVWLTRTTSNFFAGGTGHQDLARVGEGSRCPHVRQPASDHVRRAGRLLG
jgi:Flp pilus assembly protein TadG